MSPLSHSAPDAVEELYDLAPFGYISMLSDGKIVGLNGVVLTWKGRSKEEVLRSVYFQDLLTVPGRMFYETQFIALLHMQGFVQEVAFDLVRHEREPLPVLLNAKRRSNPQTGEILIHSALFDATDRRKYENELLQARKELEEEVKRQTAELKREIDERRRTEEDLRQLSSRLLNIRDHERRSLARELHDSVGQLLVALTMNLTKVIAEVEKLTPKAAAAISENTKIVETITSEIRTISYLLHPPLLDEVGLSSALAWYVEGLAERAGIKITLELSPDLGRLSEQMELTVFRIIQECLTNVHRHSGGSTARVSVLKDAEMIETTVEDNGRGMSAGISSGVGLRGMRERVKQFGGTLDVRSNERGTMVTARLPVLNP